MTSRALPILERYHRRARWVAPLWTVAAGIAVDRGLAALAIDPGARIIVLTLFAVTAVLAAFLARPSLRATAQWLDAKVGAENRFEALAEQRGRDDALARAMAGEAESFLAPRRLPRTYAWFAGMLLAVALLADLFFRDDFGVPAPIGPATSPAASAPEAAAPRAADVPKLAPAVSTPANVAPPTAVLRWLSPEAETIIGQGEDLPLRLEAESGTGLRSLELHVAVNGVERAALPSGTQVEAGQHGINLVLGSERSGAKFHDLVAYHVTADRIRPAELPAEPAWPRVTSPLQLAWVMPTEEPLVGPEGDPQLEAGLRQVEELRHEQARVVRETFGLAHELPPRAEAEWPQALDATMAAQQRFVDTAGRAAATALPDDARSALNDAVAEGRNAVARLSAQDPAAAEIVATRALLKVALAERIVARAVREARAARAAEAAALVQSETPSEALPPRPLTPAGRLERLALEQEALAERLAARELAVADAFAMQDPLAREIQQLASERRFAVEVNALVTTGADAAREATTQLNEQDAVAAIEPATRAAQALAEAVIRLDALGRLRAGDQLQAAQKAFIHTATELQLAPPDSPEAQRRAEAEARRMEEQLKAAARREQEAGSQEAARRLAALGQSSAACRNPGGSSGSGSVGTGGSGSEGSVAGPSPGGERRAGGSSDDFLALAEQADAARKELGDADEIRRRAAEDLQRAKANLQKAAEKGELRDTYEKAVAASQSARPLAETSASSGVNRPGESRGGRSGDVPAPPDATSGSGSGGMRAYADQLDRWIGERLSRVEADLREEVRRAHVLAVGNPADAPPSYREAVATYFEQLARQRATAPAATVPSAGSRAPKEKAP